MTLAEFDRAVGIVFLGYAVLIACAGVLKLFLAQRSARSAEPVTETPGSRPVTGSTVVAGSAIVHVRPGGSTPATSTMRRTGGPAITTATEDSGGEVAVPASEAEAAGPTEALITQPREDPAVLGRDRALPWSW